MVKIWRAISPFLSDRVTYDDGAKQQNPVFYYRLFVLLDMY